MGCRPRISIVYLLIVVYTTSFFAQAQTTRPAATPWSRMDYGPFLSTTLEAAQPAGNFAYKAIIIPLKPDRSVNMAFDTDLLRWSAGWDGGFIDWKCVAFDGSHETHPSMVGRQIFGNAVTPGWARAGTREFKDPRVRPFGPLPREWGHWKGLYLHDDDVVLSYEIGDAEVLETPGVREGDGLRVFTRTTQIGRSARDLVIQVCDTPGDARLEEVGGVQAVSTDIAARDCVVLADSLAIGCVSRSSELRWDASTPSMVTLRIPAAATPVRLQLRMAHCAHADVATFKSELQHSDAPPDLHTLTHGSRPRWTPALTTAGQIGRNDGPFATDSLTATRDNPWHALMRFGGFDFFAGGRRAAICTWNGDVWTVDGIDDSLEKLTWKRIATGLFQPLGLKIVGEQIYVLGRDQITRLHDLNGDGEADFYENFNNDAQVTDHFHEFAMDLQTGPDGDFYYMKAARHGKKALVPQHGTLIHVSHDGSRSEIVCNGFRAPNGLAIRSDGAMVTSDQEGYWMPMNRIDWLRPGGFYGNMWSFFTTPG